LNNFVTSALAQGRSPYDEGSAEREIINAVPTETAEQEPGQAIISGAAQTGAGVVHLVSGAPHATNFDVLHRRAGSEENFELSTTTSSFGSSMPPA